MRGAWFCYLLVTISQCLIILWCPASVLVCFFAVADDRNEYGESDGALWSDLSSGCNRVCDSSVSGSGPD